MTSFKRRSWPRLARVSAAGLLLAGLFLLSACTKKRIGPIGPPAVPVTASRVEQKDVPLQIQTVGNVEAYRTVTVKSLVDGQITGVHFEEGQNLKVGDLLFTIDPRPFEINLQKSQAALNRDIALVKQAQAVLAKDKAEAANARTEVRRYRGLLKQGFVSEDQYDQLLTNAAALDATVSADEAALQTARRTLAVDQSAVDDAGLQLQYCFIHSPINGRAGAILIHRGNLVKANDTAGLLVINQIRPVYVDFSVPQEQLDRIKRYRAGGSLQVTAVPAAREARPETGIIAFIDNAVDPDTGTVKLKGLFQNGNETLWPGRFANVALTLKIEHNAIVIPSAAVQTGQNGSYVFVINPGMTAFIRPVIVDRTQNNEAVIRQGLKPGEQVVTDGQLLLGPGVKVLIKNAPAKAPAP